MHEICLMVLLAAMSSHAMAEWEMLGSNDNGATTAYAETSPAGRNGDVVTMQSLIDLSKPFNLSNGTQFLSWQIRYEFDCKIRRARVFSALMYSGNMGHGEVTNRLNFDSPTWEAVTAGSNGEMLWNYACRKQNLSNSEQDAQKHCPDDTVVWLNLNSGVIHHKGQRWYGRTRKGAYMCSKVAARRRIAH